MTQAKSNEDVKHIVLQGPSKQQAIVEGIAIRGFASGIDYDTYLGSATFLEMTNVHK